MDFEKHRARDYFSDGDDSRLKRFDLNRFENAAMPLLGVDAHRFVRRADAAMGFCDSTSPNSSRAARFESRSSVSSVGTECSRFDAAT